VYNINNMAKVTITIDDAAPDIQSAFGTTAIVDVAAFYGWQTEVPKTEAELPAKIMKEPTPEDIEMGMTEPYETYPEGTEMNKPNPQSAADFLADFILRRHIAPALVKSYKVKRQKEMDNQMSNDMVLAEGAVVNAATIEIVE